MTSGEGGRRDAPAGKTRVLRVAGHEIPIDARWTEREDEGLVLKIESEALLEACVVVRAEKSGSLVAAANLSLNRLTATLALDSLTQPEKEFYNFTDGCRSFYTAFGDDLAERPQPAADWLTGAFRRLEEFYAHNYPARWDYLRAMAEIAIARRP